jgi:hypothetical protein
VQDFEFGGAVLSARKMAEPARAMAVLVLRRGRGRSARWGGTGDWAGRLDLLSAGGQRPGGKAVRAGLPSRQRDPCGSHLLPQQMQRNSTGQVESNQHSSSMGSGKRLHLICQLPDHPQAVTFLAGQRVR